MTVPLLMNFEGKALQQVKPQHLIANSVVARHRCGCCQITWRPDKQSKAWHRNRRHRPIGSHRIQREAQLHCTGLEQCGLKHTKASDDESKPPQAFALIRRQRVQASRDTVALNDTTRLRNWRERGTNR